MDKDGRTERATPRRRQEVRKKGQVARSTEINSALIILAVFIALRTLGRGIFEGLSDFMRFFLSNPISFELNEKTVSTLFLNIALFFLKMVLPIALIALAVGITASVAQTGLLLTTKPLKPDFKKLNPVSGASRVFSPRSLVDLLKSIIKVSIVGYLAYSIVRNHYADMIHIMGLDIWGMLSILGSIAYEIGLKVGLALLIIAIFDYVYQRYTFEKSIKMTKQEVKEEHRMTEGDPQIKAKIKRKQLEISVMRMMQAVPTADVVITNPVRLAVALKYNPDSMSAPKVVAKGQRLVAERIRDIAKEHNVPIVEDKPLAQTLFKIVEVDQEIPYSLYKAAAEILAYVYQINKRGSRI